MVVRLNVCSRMELSAAKNLSLLKSEQPYRVAASTALDENACKVENKPHQGEHGAQFYLSGRGMCRPTTLHVPLTFCSMVPPLSLTFDRSIVCKAAAEEH